MSDNESVLSSLSSSSENPEGAAAAGSASVRVKVEDIEHPAKTAMISKKQQRRLSMDEGSDLSALTSEVDDDNNGEQYGRDRRASSSAASSTSSSQAPSAADAAPPSASGSRRSSSSTTTTTSRLRARGRPPTKRNALAAAAKRQAGKLQQRRMDIDEPGSPANRYDQVDESGERATPGASTSSSSRSSSAVAVAPYSTQHLHTRGDSPIKTETDAQLSLSGRKYTPEPAGAFATNGRPDSSKNAPRHSTSPRHRHRNGSAEADHVRQTNHTSAQSLIAGDNLHEQTALDEEDETSEAEQRLAPLPPAIDNSSDEDYEEHLRNRSAGKQRKVNGNGPLSSSGSAGSLKGGRKGVTAGKKAAAARARAAAAAQRLDSSSKTEYNDVSPSEKKESGMAALSTADDVPASMVKHLSAEPHDHGETSTQNSGAEDQAGHDHARIVVTDTTVLNIDNMPSHAPFGTVSGLPMTSIDTEDAMSAVSDDTPILFKAAARAQEHQDSHPLSRVPALAVDDTYDTEHGGIEATTPMGHALSPPPNSRGRGRSPAAGRGRGRGRGGRGKRATQQQRILGFEDHDASAASAAEDATTEGVREGSPHPDTPIASDHEEEPADATVSKKRNEALEALTRIEISFAQLRDRLFLERMEEVARERWQIESGTHPELLHLVQVIEHRRAARLELARRMLTQSEASIARQNNADLRADWYDWARERSDLRKSMMDEAYIKKRKLEREKRSIERPRSEDLATILRMHAPPHHLYYEKKPAANYRPSYSAEYDIADGLARKRKLGAVGLDHEEALYDLERMGLRDPYSSGYQPSAFDPPFGPGQLATSANDHTLGGFGQQFQHPLAAQGRTVASVPQQGVSGRADLFGGYRAQANAAALAQTSQLSRPTLDDHLASSAGHPQNRAQYVKEYFASRIPPVNGTSL